MADRPLDGFAKGIVMRLITRTAACLLACAGLSAPALAHGDHPGADHTMAEPGAAPAGRPFDHRPVWKEGSGRVALDPRVRADWLADCGRRTAIERCEAYLGEYQAYYERAYSTGYPGYAPPVMMVPAAAPQEDCVETIVTEEPAPVIRRSIPRRAPARRGKRIRVD